MEGMGPDDITATNPLVVHATTQQQQQHHQQQQHQQPRFPSEPINNWRRIAGQQVPGLRQALNGPPPVFNRYPPPPVQRPQQQQQQQQPFVRLPLGQPGQPPRYGPGPPRPPVPVLRRVDSRGTLLGQGNPLQQQQQQQLQKTNFQQLVRPTVVRPTAQTPFVATVAQSASSSNQNAELMGGDTSKQHITRSFSVSGTAAQREEEERRRSIAFTRIPTSEDGIPPMDPVKPSVIMNGGDTLTNDDDDVITTTRPSSSRTTSSSDVIIGPTPTQSIKSSQPSPIMSSLSNTDVIISSETNQQQLMDEITSIQRPPPSSSDTNIICSQPIFKPSSVTESRRSSDRSSSILDRTDSEIEKTSIISNTTSQRPPSVMSSSVSVKSERPPSSSAEIIDRPGSSASINKTFSSSPLERSLAAVEKAVESSTSSTSNASNRVPLSTERPPSGMDRPPSSLNNRPPIISSERSSPSPSDRSQSGNSLVERQPSPRPSSRTSSIGDNERISLSSTNMSNKSSDIHQKSNDYLIERPNSALKYENQSDNLRSSASSAGFIDNNVSNSSVLSPSKSSSGKATPKKLNDKSNTLNENDIPLIKTSSTKNNSNDSVVINGTPTKSRPQSSNNSSKISTTTTKREKSANDRNIKKEGDHDSGVDESTQGNDTTTNGEIASPKKSPSKSGISRKGLTSPTKTPRSPTKTSKAPPKTPDNSAPPSTADKKKLPMNKIQVGAAPSPNLKTVRSKIGSLDNASYRPGGGNVKIEHRKLEFGKAASSKIAAKNDNYIPGGGDKKITHVKLQWNAKPKVGSLDNAMHKPGGGDKKIETVKLEFKDKAKPKVGSKENVRHTPGGGIVKNEQSGDTTDSAQIENQKLEFKAQSKIGSLANVTHKPGGGDIKIFNDKNYLKQMSVTGITCIESEEPSSGAQLTSALLMTSKSSRLNPMDDMSNNQFLPINASSSTTETETGTETMDETPSTLMKPNMETRIVKQIQDSFNFHHPSIQSVVNLDIINNINNCDNVIGQKKKAHASCVVPYSSYTSIKTNTKTKFPNLLSNGKWNGTNEAYIQAKYPTTKAYLPSILHKKN